MNYFVLSTIKGPFYHGHQLRLCLPISWSSQQQILYHKPNTFVSPHPPSICIASSFNKIQSRIVEDICSDIHNKNLNCSHHRKCKKDFKKLDIKGPIEHFVLAPAEGCSLRLGWKGPCSLLLKNREPTML